MFFRIPLNRLVHSACLGVVAQVQMVGVRVSCVLENGNKPRAVLGLFIGAVLVQYASYRWVFWLAAILSIPVALGCVFVIPSEVVKPKDVGSAKWKSLDLIGISIFTGVSQLQRVLIVHIADLSLTVALVLFIYGVTSGSADGWTTARVLVPLIVSILLTVGFFYWETLIPFEKAAM